MKEKNCTNCSNLKPFAIIKVTNNMDCIECGKSFVSAPIPEYYKVKVWCSNCRYEEIRAFKKGLLPFNHACSNCMCEKTLVGTGDYIN